MSKKVKQKSSTTKVKQQKLSRKVKQAEKLGRKVKQKSWAKKLSKKVLEIC